ncbi:MAG: outer membrane beta-barrel protein [Alphaproteobacteria bacterium]|nr:outer membrane beta-barrel protein [Alphaproteobacteria bacterium]
MSMALRIAGAALALSAVAFQAAPAGAQMAGKGAEGFYLMGAIGPNFARDSDFESSTFDLEAELDTGWTLSGGFGYAYGNGIRTELELGIRDNEVSDVSGASASGDVRSQSIMGNLYYDFDSRSRWTPYVGAGIGLTRIKAAGISPVSGTSIRDKDTTFGAQAMAGVAYAMTDRLALTLGYRYFMAPDVTWENSAGADVDSDYSTHEVLVGLRFTFGGPKPAPAPMPAAQPAPPPAAEPAPAPPPQAAPAPPPVPRNYIVFFDWNSATLSQAARDILRTAADNAGKTGVVRIGLTGHADRSGPTRYNQRLSERRAAAVKAELERLGVSAREIAVVGRGESQPLVATDDGVREPRNRRVEIVLD